MANIDDTATARWVDDRMGLLNASEDWQPDVERALRRVRAFVNEGDNRYPRRTPLRRIALAAVILSILLPASYVIAQRVWNIRRLAAAEELRLNVEEQLSRAQAALPFAFVVPPRAAQSVGSLDDAARVIGFQPQRPIKGTLRDIFGMFRDDPLGAMDKVRWLPQWGKQKLVNPRVSVTGTVVGETRINVAALEESLRTSGNGDVTVPQNWDGTVIRLEIGPTVLAEYRDGDVLVAQSRRISYTSASNVSVSQLVGILMKILGAKPLETAGLHDSFLANPWLFMFIPPHTPVEIIEARIANAPAILILNSGSSTSPWVISPGPSEVLLVWNTADRFYAIKGKITIAQAIAIAYSLK